MDLLNSILGFIAAVADWIGPENLIMLKSGLFKIAFGALAVIMLVQLLGLFDDRISRRLAVGHPSPFLEAWQRMLEDPRALGDYLGKRLIGCALLIGLALNCLLLAFVLRPLPAQAASVFPRQYDRAIEQAAGLYLPAVPWRLWKAQLYQESRLNPAARSPVGAEGLAQFMPGTWAEVTRAMGWGLVDRRMAEPAIQAGAYYMARLRKGWSAPRPERDRHNLAMASYNAGLGNILAAQKACGDPPLYERIMACLGRVTGKHAAETLGYAPAIRRWHVAMEAER